MKYKVKEIFKSIQGEGYHAGRSAVFLRFSGCNLWTGRPSDRSSSICSFCDTDFVGTDGSNGGSFDLSDLIKKIENVWNYKPSIEKKFIVLTGGEPLLQVDEKLIEKLKDHKFYIALETNGTIDTKLSFDWVCVSPKEDASWKLKRGNELKIVYPQYKFNLTNLTKLDFDFFFLQPKYDNFKRVNEIKTINYCKRNSKWFPSFQIHKILGIN